MSLLKRISASFVTRIDQVVGEIENHDAVIDVLLKDLRRKIAAARVRLLQVERESGNLQQQRGRLLDDARRWRQRARQTASADEAKALDCLRRARRCDAEAQRNELAGDRFAETATCLAREIRDSEARVRELSQKLMLMRARQSSGEAIGAGNEMQCDLIRQAESSFERWEMSLSQLDAGAICHQQSDPLEREFDEQEELQSLRRELSGLQQGEGEK